MANPRLPDSEQVIASFVEQYEYRFDFYSNVAGKASQLCETALKQEGVRAISSFRAKNSERLKTKLHQRLAWRREKGNEYADEAAISNDLVDLAGVRIALYFPDDRAQVESIISKTFEVVAKKRLGGYKESVLGIDPSFDGYCADHYHVRLRDQGVYGTALVEIQVASVLMHAWSEVNHDLAYKPLQGQISKDEVRILDALNGLVLTGEVILKQLQSAINERAALQERKFADQYELGAYLNKKAVRHSDSTSSMGPVDLLFDVLQILRLDSPHALDATIEHWNKVSPTDSPIALSLLEYVLTTTITRMTASEAALLFTPAPVDEDEYELTMHQALVLDEAVRYYDNQGKLGHSTRKRSVRDLAESERSHAIFLQQLDIVETFSRIGMEKGGPTQLKEAVRVLWSWFTCNSDQTARLALSLARLEQQSVSEHFVIASSASQRLPIGLTTL